MAGKVVKDLNEDFLVCSICTEQFKTPKMLPCIHSFCEGCLDKYAAKQDDTNQVPCPTCRKVCTLPETGVKGLQTNFHLINLAERVNILEKLTSSQKKVTACESCKCPEIVAFCTDCNLAICSKCQGHHALFPVLRNHDVIPLNKLQEPKFQQEWKASKSPYCDLHASEKLRFFCKTCSKLICRDCTIIMHSKHECTEAMIQFKSSRDALSKLVERGNDYLQKGVHFVDKGEKGFEAMVTANRNVELEIDEHCNDMMTKIEEAFNAKKQAMVKEIAVGHDFVKTQIQFGKEWIERMKNTLEISQKLLEENNPWEVIAMSSDLDRAFTELTDESSSLNWLVCDLKCDIKFTPSLEVPAIQLGSYDFLPDFVLNDNQGNFFLCQFHSATDTFVIHMKAYNNNTITKYAPIKCHTKIKKSGDLFACCDTNNSLYFVFGSTVAVIPNNYTGVQVYSVKLQGEGTKIQFLSYIPQHGYQSIASDSLENNMIMGSSISDNQGNYFKTQITYTLKATSPVTYILPATYDVLYYTEADGLNTFDWNNYNTNKQYQIEPPENIMDISKSKIIYASNDNYVSKYFPNYGNRYCSTFSVFILWKGTAEGANKDDQLGEAWVIKEYNTKNERVVGILECLRGEAMSPLALFNVLNGTGGMDIYLCDYTGTITKYTRGPYNNEPLQYVKA